MSPLRGQMLLRTASHRFERRLQHVQPGHQIDLIENRDGKRNRSDRILGSARIPGVAERLADVFLDVELFDFQIQRRARNSESDGGSIWSGNLSIALRQRGFNEFLLIALDGLREKT